MYAIRSYYGLLDNIAAEQVFAQCHRADKSHQGYQQGGFEIDAAVQVYAKQYQQGSDVSYNFV